MIKKYTGAWLLLCLIFVVGVYRVWFFTLNTFTWGDWGWYFAQTVRPWLDVPRIWLAGPFGGIDFSIFQYLPNRLLYSALAYWFPSEVFDRIVFLLPSVILPTISGFFLIKYLTKNNLSASIGSLMYSLNAYTAVTRTGHFTLSNSFALAPLILLFVIKSLDTKKFINSIWAGLVSALAFAYEPRAFLLSIGIVILYGAYYIVLVANGDFKNRLKLISFIVYPLLIVVLLHFYAFIGLFFAQAQIYSQITNRALFGSGYVDVNRALSLAISSWNEIPGKALQQIPFYFWITTITSVAGMWVGRKNKNILFFSFVALMGIFLAKHTNQPFGGVYVWLYKYLPGFNAFREPSKFYFFIALGFCVLTGWFIDWLTKTQNKLVKWTAVIIAFMPLIMNGLIISTGKVGKLMTPRKIPADYLTLKNFLLSHQGNYRVMYVPAETRWGYWDEHIRKLSAVNMSLSFWKELAPYNLEGKDYSYLENIMKLMEQDDSNEILDVAGIRYVIVPPEDLANEDIFTYAWGTRQEFLGRVDKLTYLKPLDIHTKSLRIYENSDWKPLIYLSEGKEVIGNEQKTINVSYVQHKPYYYELSLPVLTGLKSPVLNFTDEYNRGWKMYSGKVSWVDVLLNRNYIGDVAQSSSIIHTNEFSLSDQHQYPNMITIYFQPQAFINFGVVVSLGFFGLLGIGLIYYSFSKKQ